MEITKATLRDAEALTVALASMTVRDVAGLIGCTPSYVSRRAILMNVERPTAGERRRVHKIEDYQGQRFGRMIVIGEATRATRSGNFRVTCRCDCGGEKVIAVSALIGQHPGWDHCGCQSAERWSATGRAKRIHGGRSRADGDSRRVATYRSWASMMDRCYRETTNGYERYGGVGIVVCAAWHEFTAFLSDMGDRPDGRTLDRIDGTGNYEPGNCRWATPSEQARNRRPRTAAA